MRSEEGKCDSGGNGYGQQENTREILTEIHTLVRSNMGHTSGEPSADFVGTGPDQDCK
jgi:hypothetical protein